jgi:signal transduction histidine kinase/DNA-binding NarL/FixJ family response regulator
MNLASKLLKEFQNRYLYAEDVLQTVAIAGLVAYPLVYFFQQELLLRGHWDDIVPRALACVLFACLGLRKLWPANLKPHYVLACYVTLIYALPFFHTLVLLQNHGDMASSTSMWLAILLVLLLADWKNSVAVMLLGSGSALLLHAIIEPGFAPPQDYAIQLPAWLLASAGGVYLKCRLEKAEEGRKSRDMSIVALCVEAFSKATTREHTEAQTALRSLAGSVAHEMRNPLSQIKYALENIANGLSVASRANQSHGLEAQVLHDLHQHVAIGQGAIKRGLQAISMILDEVRSTPVDTAKFALLQAGKVTENAIREYGFDGDEERRKVSVSVHQDFLFRGDEALYTFALCNLVKNALYYFRLSPAARLTITIDPQRIRVRDTGPGIAQERLPYLFEPFQTAGKTGGTGLGLAYCKRVMAAFGGSIECKSILGEYTEFTLRFPEVSPENLATREQERPQPDGTDALHDALRGKTMLVVDDEQINRKIVRSYLEKWGVLVLEAESGAAALDRLKTQSSPNTVDAILMDLNMPGLDGMEATRRIRTAAMRGSDQQLPIIALTANFTDDLLDDMRAAGMTDVVGKPIDINVLHEKLLGLFSGSGACAASPVAGARDASEGSPTKDTEPLLDMPRLARMGEIAPEFLREEIPLTLERMREVLNSIRNNFERNDHAAVLFGLHTLMGIGGECGALALHRFIRYQVYAEVDKGHWPSTEHWLETIEDLFERTDTAMHQYLAHAALASP